MPKDIDIGVLNGAEDKLNVEKTNDIKV